MISFKRYNEGFNRLGIAFFVAAAFVFAGYYLALDHPYQAPDPNTIEGEAVLAAIAADCAEREQGMMANLCERSEQAKLKIQYYDTEFAAGRYSKVLSMGGIVAAIGVFAAFARWIVAGFRLARPEPLTEEAKVRRYLEDTIRSSTTDGEGVSQEIINLLPKKPEKDKNSKG